jgi:alkylation response protein AidB-like acyl-CoA dehydrogenase
MVSFAMPEATEQFRADLRSWLDANVTAEVRDAGRRRGSDPGAFEASRAWDRHVADEGWAAISWPSEYGGRGATVLEQLVHAEETSRAEAPLPINVIGMNNIAPAIMQHGTEDQKRTLLPRMRRSDDIWCQGMSEPEAGSDLASLRTRAERDGADFVINGQKIWTSLGHRADWCQLFVRTDPDAPKHNGISCLIVAMDGRGIDARPLVAPNGDEDFAEVFFDDVHVPATALLGPLNGGWAVATTTLSYERAGAARLYAEMQVRLRRLAADLSADDAGLDSGLDDPAVLERLGELQLRADYLQILCERSISAALHGGDPFGTASLAKTVWGELGQDLAAVGFDLAGDRSTEWSDHRLTSRCLTIAGGTTQVNKNITARHVLGLPRS